MLTYIDAVIENLQRRLQNIEDDKRLKKVYTLKRQTLPPEKIWNLEQEPKVQHHLKESSELKGYINGKLNYHNTFKKQHVSLASLIHNSHKKNIKANSPLKLQNEINETDSDTSIDEIALKKIHKRAGSISASSMKALLGVDMNELMSNSTEGENDSIKKENDEFSLDDSSTSSPAPQKTIIDTTNSSQKEIHVIQKENETSMYF